MDKDSASQRSCSASGRQDGRGKGGEERAMVTDSLYFDFLSTCI